MTVTEKEESETGNRSLLTPEDRKAVKELIRERKSLFEKLSKL